MKSDGMARLLELVAALRAEGGCPWDRKQTIASMSKYLVEEAAEAADAALDGDADRTVEELGDLLLVVAMMARILEESTGREFSELTAGIADKIVRRHPHVFGEGRAETPEEVVAAWDKIKRGEEKKELFFEHPPKSLAPLELMLKLQTDASRLGFDWKDAAPVADKVREETAEFLAEVERGSSRIESEFGDLIFSLVNLSRFLRIDPVNACRLANLKFVSRLQYIKREGERDGRTFESLSFEEMDALWDRAKGAGL